MAVQYQDSNPVVFPTLPKYNSYNDYDPSEYYTTALGFLPIDTRYVSNTTNSLTYNSMADVLFNKAAWDARWENSSTPWMNDWWAYYPRVTIDTFLLAKDTVFDPIAQGVKENGWAGFTRGSSTALLNSLINLDNTLDVVSNPIKGAVIEGFKSGGKNAFEGFWNGLIGAENGRKQYDYGDYIKTDSGLFNTASSFALEFASDPLNWFSFGGKQLVSSGADAVTNAATKSIKSALNTALDKGLKTVDELVPELKSVASYMSDDTAKAFLKTMADESDNLIKEAIDPTVDSLGVGLKKAITQVGLKGGGDDVISKLSADIATGKTTRLKAGMIDVNPAKITPATQMATSEFLSNAATTMPDLFRTNADYLKGIKIRGVSDTVQTGLLHTAGLTGLDAFIGSYKLTKYLGDVIKVRHAEKAAPYIVRTVEDLDADLRIDLDSVPIGEFASFNKASTDSHRTVVNSLNDLKTEFSAKLIEMSNTNQLTKESYKNLQLEFINKIDALFKNQQNLAGSLDDYIAKFKQMRSYSKTQLNELDDIINQLEAYREVFNKTLTDTDFKFTKQSLRFYEEAINMAYSDTQADNIAKSAANLADIQTKLKTVKAASNEMLDKFTKQAERVAVRDAQLDEAINTILTNDDIIKNNTDTVEQALKFNAGADTDIQRVSFNKAYEEYQKAYNDYFDAIHDSSKTPSDLTDAKFRLVDTYNKVLESYEINISGALKHTLKNSKDTALLGSVSDLQSFIKSTNQINIDKVDELIDLEQYVKGNLVSYTLMTNQTRYLTDLAGINLDGSARANAGFIDGLLSNYHIGNPLYDVLNDKSIKPTSVKGVRYARMRGLLERFAVFQTMSASLNELCVKNKLPKGYTQGLLDALVTELQSGKIRIDANFNDIANEMLRKAELYFTSHLADKHFSMDTVLHTVATDIFNKTASDDVRAAAKQVLDSLEDAHNGAVDVDNWIRLVKLSEESDDPIIKQLGERLASASKGKRTIVFDLETTGAKELTATPYQIAGKVLDENLNVIEEFNFYIRPKKGIRPLDSVLKRLAPSTVAKDVPALHKWWDDMWANPAALNAPVFDSAFEGVRAFQDICAKYADDGVVFAGQNIRSFDIELLKKFSSSDFKDILVKSDTFDSLDFMQGSSYFTIKDAERTILKYNIADALRPAGELFNSYKLFSGKDVELLKQISFDFKSEKHIKQLMDDVVKTWYTPPDFNATKYFTVTKLDPTAYTDKMTNYINTLIAQGLINVPGTSNIMRFLNQNTSFDAVKINAKQATSWELTNVFSLNKMENTVVTRGVAERLTHQSRRIIGLRSSLKAETIEKLLPDAKQFLQILQDDALLEAYGIKDFANNYAKWIEVGSDDALTVATALYYWNNAEDLGTLTEMFFKEDLAPTVLYYKNIDPVTNKPRFIYEDDYYNYEDFAKLLKIDDPFDVIKAYNTEHNIYNAHKAAIHKMQSDNLALAERVIKILNIEAGRSKKAYKRLERMIYQYNDYLDEQAIKEILTRPDRVQAFKNEAKLRAGRVYFETPDAIDLSDFTKEDGVIAKSIEIFDEKTGKSLGYGHAICLTKDAYNAVEDVTCGVNFIKNIPDLPESLFKAIRDNRLTNGQYVTNIGWSHGDILTKQHIQSFDKMIQTKFGIDPDALIDINTLTAQEYFSTVRANNIIIGGRDVFNRVCYDTDLIYCSDPFKLTFYNTSGPVSHAKSKLAAYLNLFFSENNRIDSDLFNKFTNADLAELSKRNKASMGWYYLERPHTPDGAKPLFFSDRTVYKSALTGEEKTGYILREIPIINEHSIEVAKKAGAYCLPRAQANQLMQTVNTFKLPPLAEFARNVSTVFKVAYLGSVGMVIRNCIDSNYKTRWALDGTVTVPDQIKHLFSTMQMIKKYDAIGQLYSSKLSKYFATDLDYELFYKTILNWDDADVITKIAADYSDDMTEMVTRKVNEVIKTFDDADIKGIKSSLLDPDTFSVVDSFIRFGPSSGMSQSVLDNIITRTADTSITNKLVTWMTEQSPWHFVYGWNDMVEQSARLSMFLQDVSRGSTVDDAINNILRAHFDYSDKSLAMLYTEIVFPFMNFSYKNLEYWVNAIYKYPALVGELENIFRPILNYNSLFTPDPEAYAEYAYTFDWSKNVTSFEANAPWTMINAARLYHILNGNIVIDTGRDVEHDAGYGTKTNDLYAVFKLSPSFLDAVKMLYSPLNSYSERMLPPYETMLNIFNNIKDGENISEQVSLMSLLSNLPYADTIIQRIGIENISSDGIKLKHNNLNRRIVDAGPLMAIGSLFGAAYVPQKDKMYYYDSDYNVLGGFKSNYYGKRYYSNSYQSRNPRYTLTRMAQNRRAKDIYVSSKKARLADYRYNAYIHKTADSILKQRLKDYNYYL